MSHEMAQAAGMVEVVYTLHGRALPRDHAAALAQALCARLPWLGQAAQAGVHPLRLVSGTGDLALVSARSRLWLRVAAEHVATLLQSPVIELDVDGHALRLTEPHPRALVPHGTVYAHRVAASSADEAAFMAMVNATLAAMGVMGQRICGRHQLLGPAAAPRHAFSLMLHDLTPEQSLRVQEVGIGADRLLGYGLFVPHKSAAAV